MQTRVLDDKNMRIRDLPHSSREARTVPCSEEESECGMFIYICILMGAFGPVFGINFILTKRRLGKILNGLSTKRTLTKVYPGQFSLTCPLPERTFFPQVPPPTGDHCPLFPLYPPRVSLLDTSKHRPRSVPSYSVTKDNTP